MSSFDQKQTLKRNLPAMATEMALQQIKRTGLALPGSVLSIDSTGTIVTVKFEVADAQLQPVQMPVFGPEYIRYPIQEGDRGVAFPASTYIGNVTGLGYTQAPQPIATPMNLSALVWFPCGNKNFTPTQDANKLVMYGPNGVFISDEAHQSTIDITSSSITCTHGGHTIVINSTGVIIDGKNFLTHTHTGVQSGGSNSGPVT